MPTPEPTLAELIEAVQAEDRHADLDGAVRRSGAQNYVLETEEWIYRFPRRWIDFDLEVRVLGALDSRLPVEIPRIEWVGQRSRFSAYRKIIGRPFDRDDYRSATRARQLALAASMADYLAAVHAALTETEIAAIGIPDFFTLAERTALVDLDRVPEPVRDPVVAMLDRAREVSARLDGRLLLDNDFTSDNIVLNDARDRLTGVWDFSGVTIGPASVDFRALLREPDPLTDDIVDEYERRTGRKICREAYLIALRLTDLLRAIRSGPADVVHQVDGWRSPRGHWSP
jgi:aminoglycoside phosphotransferase (APT) family kinase protein